ncbi:MAG: hypothetical protein LLF76_11815 [Planctomycetaceae bacterium]|nr:hypothetical protein [Planctomycetaceae bacterium]
MPDFANPFSGMTPGRKLTLSELTRALRIDLASEEEAIHLYEAQADATDNNLAKIVLRDIANEERVHAGEFQRLLTILLHDEAAFIAQGAEEVDEMQAGGPEAKNQQSPPEVANPVPTIGTLKTA